MYLGVGGLFGPADDATRCAEVLPSALPERLSETGLYTDISREDAVAEARRVSPAQRAVVRRCRRRRAGIQLPDGATDRQRRHGPLDSSRSGTKLFKEFALDGKRLETRLIWRVADTGNREQDTLVGAYVWNDDESDAYVREGRRRRTCAAPTTTRRRPTRAGAATSARPGTSSGSRRCRLGDVSGAAAVDPPPAGTTYAAPNAALGYLHANCGHCHNPEGGAWVDSHMILRLDVDERDAADDADRADDGRVDLEQWINHGYTKRIVAGDPDHERAVLPDDSQRTMNVQMPPLATEHTDPTRASSSSAPGSNRYEAPRLSARPARVAGIRAQLRRPRPARRRPPRVPTEPAADRRRPTEREATRA